MAERQRGIRHLLDEQNPADAMAAYFAFYHDEAKTILRPYPSETNRAEGYVCLSRTGMDLFRKLVTMRLPLSDMQASTDLIYQAMQPGSAVILSIPEPYNPLIQALFEVASEEKLRLFALRATRFEPIINVLITQDRGANGLPRFLIRDRQNSNVAAASAGLNWQTRRFAEISVNTHPQYRRQGYGRSVVAAMANYLLSNGRTPLYAVSEGNQASIQLAQQVGFQDTLVRQMMIQGSLKPPLQARK
ncbi:MAG: GNAT family N-acetyltransferase [Chloroflexi bacterium]|nr:GNAT family N-acetyltransferase [Chloroflexota bacterium]